MKNNFHCYICFYPTEEEFVCDMCDNYYCDKCSYTFTIHYQFQGGRCYRCSGQSRRGGDIVTKKEIRSNKLKYIFNI